MALTTAQKAKIIQVLGYPAKSLDPDSVLYDKVLSDRLEDIPSDSETLAVSYLTSIAAIETQILAAPARFIAEQVGDIKLNTAEIEKLRKERKTLAKELGALLDVPYIGKSNSIGVVC
jgi:hypothetical protein